MHPVYPSTVVSAVISSLNSVEEKMRVAKLALDRGWILSPSYEAIVENISDSTLDEPDEK